MDELARCVTQAADLESSDTDRYRAFGMVVDRFQDMAYGYAFGLLGDRHMAEDAAQEGFIIAWENLGSLRVPEAFPGWFRRIVQWQCQRFRRVNSPVFAALDEDIPSERDNPSDDAERNDTIRTVRLAIGMLPDTLRDVTMLYYVGDYTQTEISRFLDLPEGTVRKRLYDARHKLKKNLLRKLGEDLPGQAPSRNSIFGGNVMKWVKPDFSTEQGHFTGGDSEQVWEMLLAAVTGDANKVSALLKEDSRLASCN